MLMLQCFQGKINRKYGFNSYWISRPNIQFLIVQHQVKWEHNNEDKAKTSERYNSKKEKRQPRIQNKAVSLIKYWLNPENHPS